MDRARWSGCRSHRRGTDALSIRGGKDEPERTQSVSAASKSLSDELPPNARTQGIVAPSWNEFSWWDCLNVVHGFGNKYGAFHRASLLIYNRLVSRKELNEAFLHDFRPDAYAIGKGGRGFISCRPDCRLRQCISVGDYAH